MVKPQDKYLQFGDSPCQTVSLPQGKLYLAPATAKLRKFLVAFAKAKNHAKPLRVAAIDFGHLGFPGE